VRERKENLAKQELASALSRLSGSEQTLRTLEADLQHAREEQRAATSQSNTVDATELAARQAFLERIEVQRGTGARELREHEQDVCARDLELVRAAREHEMLKRLKERQHSEHDREMDRREQVALDEIASQNFRRSVA
jgi:flagellar export protein FliJ